MNGINFNANYSNYQNFNQVPKQDPDSYAQKYAQENNLSLEEAKAELKSKFGDPSEGANVPFLGQQDNVSIFSNRGNEDQYASIGNNFNDFQFTGKEANYNFDDFGANTDFGSKNLSSENNFFKNILNMFRNGNHTTELSNKPSPDKDPDEYAKEYAEENNITVEEAKEELGAKYGEPEKPSAQNPFNFS